MGQLQSIVGGWTTVNNKALELVQTLNHSFYQVKIMPTHIGIPGIGSHSFPQFLYIHLVKGVNKTLRLHTTNLTAQLHEAASYEVHGKLLQHQMALTPLILHVPMNVNKIFHGSEMIGKWIIVTVSKLHCE